jgi:DNA-binding NarL/FixJ family response regulator
MTKLRLLLADDHKLVRAGLRALLERMADVEVVAETADGQDALRLIAELRPDLALVDVSMPGLNGIETAARTAREHPATRVLIVSMHLDEEYVHRALSAGASGYLLKTSDIQELEIAVRAVARGETWLSPDVSARAMRSLGKGDRAAASPYDLLTQRQREVLQLIAEGRSTKQIAQRLGISIKTVETHRSELMERLGIHGIAGLVRYAIRAGIVRPDS